MPFLLRLRPRENGLTRFAPRPDRYHWHGGYLPLVLGRRMSLRPFTLALLASWNLHVLPPADPGTLLDAATEIVASA